MTEPRDAKLLCIDCRHGYWPRHAEGRCNHETVIGGDLLSIVTTTTARANDGACGPNGNHFERIVK